MVPGCGLGGCLLHDGAYGSEEQRRMRCFLSKGRMLRMARA
jgi:hypothetical protein